MGGRYGGNIGGGPKQHRGFHQQLGHLLLSPAKPKKAGFEKPTDVSYREEPKESPA